MTVNDFGFYGDGGPHIVTEEFGIQFVPISGSCCRPSGCINKITELTCELLGGNYEENPNCPSSCTPNGVPVETCLLSPISCLDSLNQEDCKNLNGTWISSTTCQIELEYNIYI